MSKRKWMPPTVVLIGQQTPKETFCYDCGQLRLWLKEEEPKACGYCKSKNIIVGELNSAELTKARNEWCPKR